MTALPNCLQAADSTDVLAWLNANAGAITGIATAALAGLTWRYVVLTKRLADAAVNQAGSALEQTRLLAAAQVASSTKSGVCCHNSCATWSVKWSG